MELDHLTYTETTREELVDLIKTLAVIPAPSHHEEKRVAFVKEWMERNGAEGVYVDDALNVVWPYHVTGDNDVVVFMAHTDIVFSEEVKLALRQEGNNLSCPGVGDDTARLCVLLMAARYLTAHHLPTSCGVLFVANSCEEGLGNLKGSRKIIETYGDRIKRFITFDGNMGTGVETAVGSHRYRVTVRTEGGHSWAKFGNQNAIQVASSLVNTLYTVKVPQVGKSRTTYNVGGITGGTSVNTIAQNCELLYEYRSDNAECLAKMKQIFETVIEAYRGTGAEVEVELLGERPCNGDLDPAAMQALKDTVAACYQKCGMGFELRAGSTDANIPLSRGIPALCVGNADGYGAHTVDEYLDLSSLPGGLLFTLDLITALTK